LVLQLEVLKLAIELPFPFLLQGKLGQMELGNLLVILKWVPPLW